MKILYGAGNINGSNIRLSHFLRNTSDHVRVAAFYNQGEFLNEISWLLDPVCSGTDKSQPMVELMGEPTKANLKNLEIMLDNISEWDPELIISDYEFITAKIAKVLDIPLISCTPLHLVDGVQWSTRNKKFFNKIHESLNEFNHSVEKLIYSPFGALESAPKLINGFDWITPYPDPEIRTDRNISRLRASVLSNGGEFSIGDSGHLYSKILEGKKICVFDSPDEIESKLNGIFVDTTGIGKSVGQAENNIKYAARKIYEFSEFKHSYLINKEPEFLHQRLDL